MQPPYGRAWKELLWQGTSISVITDQTEASRSDPGMERSQDVSFPRRIAADPRLSQGCLNP